MHLARISGPVLIDNTGHVCNLDLSNVASLQIDMSFTHRWHLCLLRSSGARVMMAESPLSTAIRFDFDAEFVVTRGRPHTREIIRATQKI